MADITIIIMENGAETRKRLKAALPPSMRESLKGREVEMESGEQLRDKLPEGFPRKFVVPEEVLVFPDEAEEPEPQRKRRRRLREMSLKSRRKKLPGNTES